MFLIFSYENKYNPKYVKHKLLLKSLKQEDECAIMLENITNYIIRQSKTNKSETTEIIADTLIPITRRIYDGGIKSINCKFLYNEYEKFLQNKPKINSKIKDKEAELCSLFSDKIISSICFQKNRENLFLLTL